MYKFYMPVKQTAFGQVKGLADFFAAIRTYGQGFYGNAARACDFIPGASCDVSIYQYWGRQGHGALDIPAPAGTEICAIADGRVVEVQNDPRGGLEVKIFHPQYTVTSTYLHNRENLVVVGQEVKARELIARVDSTGYSTGNHLHLETKYTDESGNTVQKDNGWGGRFDPSPYFVWGDIMTDKEVKLLYALAFYRAPDAGELAYWTGKELSAFLAQAIKDRSEFLKKEVEQ